MRAGRNEGNQSVWKRGHLWKGRGRGREQEGIKEEGQLHGLSHMSFSDVCEGVGAEAVCHRAVLVSAMGRQM